MTERAPTILTLVAAYYPGYKAGGPIQSMVNLVQRLGDDYRFKVITGDRDLKDSVPYQGVEVGKWLTVGKAEVLYVDASKLSLWDMRNRLVEGNFDILYLNSFFNPTFTIKPLILRRLGLIPPVPVVVAPRGELSEGALGLKSLKKQIYLYLSRLFSLYQGAVWHACSDGELQDIQRVLGGHSQIYLAPNLAAVEGVHQESAPRIRKTKGCLRIVFLSRISPMKNLQGAIELLAGVRGMVELDIYGPIEDAAYWSQCQEAAERVPENVTVSYRGQVEHQRVQSTLAQYDLFFLPTLGENFGHVIVEALRAGCPVLISNRTPWVELQCQGVGWELPLEEPQRFRAVLQQCVDMDAVAHEQLSDQARAFGRQVSNDPSAVASYSALFTAALSCSRNA